MTLACESSHWLDKEQLLCLPFIESDIVLVIVIDDRRLQVFFSEKWRGLRISPRGVGDEPGKDNNGRDRHAGVMIVMIVNDNLLW